MATMTYRKTNLVINNNLVSSSVDDIINAIGVGIETYEMLAK